MGKLAPFSKSGTSQSGKHVSVTAESASSKLDYDGVVSACDNALTAAQDAMKEVSSQLHDVQMGKEALCVEDKDFQPMIDECGDYFMKIPAEGIAPTLEQVKDETMTQYNKIQEELNQKAEAEYNRQMSQ